MGSFFVEYTSITDVRNHIDQIDSELVKLIAQRAQCVKAAAAFKTDQASVRAPDRVQQGKATAFLRRMVTHHCAVTAAF